MSKKPETNFKERIAPKLLLIQKSWWVKTQFVGIRGIPDYLGCINGKFVALELKKDSKAAASALQTYCMRKIIAAGGYGRFASPENWEEIYLDLLELARA